MTALFEEEAKTRPASLVAAIRFMSDWSSGADESPLGLKIAKFSTGAGAC